MTTISHQAGTLSIQLGGLSSNHSRGQSFLTPGEAFTLKSATFEIGKSGSPTDNLSLEIYSGPGTGLLGTADQVIAGSDIAAVASSHTFTFSPALNLSANTTYYWRLTRSGPVDGTNYFTILGESTGTYADGQSYSITDTGTWNALAGDINFSLTSDIILAGLSTSSLFASPVGPFKSSAGEFYILGNDETSGPGFAMLKATDPSSSWTLIDQTSGGGGTMRAIAAHQDGDDLHVVYASGTNTTAIATGYGVFSMASDTWTTAPDPIAISSAVDTSSTSLGTPVAMVSITMRSTGELVVFRNDLHFVTMGKNYAHVVCQRKPAGGSWGGFQSVDTGGATDYHHPMAVLGVSDNVHLIYGPVLTGSGSATHMKTLGATNALSGQVSASLSDEPRSAIAYDRDGAGTIRVAVSAVRTDSTPGAAYFDSSATPTFTEAQVDASFTASVSPHRIFEDNGDLYQLILDSTSEDLFLYTSTDDGANWTQVGAGAVFTGSILADDNSLSRCAKVYISGGNYVIPLVVRDNGVIKYDEIVLRSAATGTQFDQGIEATASTSTTVSLSVAKNVLATSLATVVLGRSISKAVSAAASSVTSMVKGAAKSVAASAFGTVTVNAGRALNQFVSVAASTATSLTKGAARSIATSASTSVSAVKTASKRLSAGVASAASLAKAAGKTVAAACGTAVSAPLKAVSKALSVSAASSVILGASKAFLVTVSAAVATQVSLLKNATRTLVATLGPSVSVTKQVTKTIAASLASSVSLVRSIGKGISAAAASAVSVAADLFIGAVTFPVTINAAVLTQVSVIKQAAKSVAASAVSSASMVRSTLKVVSATATATATVQAIKAFMVNLLAGVSSAVSIARNASYHRLIEASVSTAAAIAKAIGKTASIAATTIVAVKRLTAKSISVAGLTTVAVVATRAFLLTISAAVSTSVTLSRSVGKGVSASVTSAVSFAKAMARTITVAASTTASATRRVSKSISSTVTSSVQVATSFAFTVILAAAVATSSSLIRSIGKLVPVSLTGNVSTRKAIALTPITVVATTAVRVRKRIAKKVSTTVSWLVSIFTQFVLRPSSRPLTIVQGRFEDVTVLAGSFDETIERKGVFESAVIILKGSFDQTVEREGVFDAITVVKGTF